MIKAGRADTGNVFAQTQIRRKMDSEHAYMLTCLDTDVVECKEGPESFNIDMLYLVPAHSSSVLSIFNLNLFADIADT